ncbi:unnamed protein product [Arabidopsis lyrata]|nr:unnamed protein product [Arabidopsis lyrata]
MSMQDLVSPQEIGFRNMANRSYASLQIGMEKALPLKAKSHFSKIPTDLHPFLPEIVLLKPDKGLLHYFDTIEAKVTVWSNKIETRQSGVWKETIKSTYSQGSHEGIEEEQRAAEV